MVTKVIRDISEIDFEFTVTEHLKQGFSIQGGVSHIIDADNDHWFACLMVKED